MTDDVKLWEKSFWLSKSAETFATHVYKDEWKAALERRGDKLWFEELKASAVEAKESGKDGLESLHHAVMSLHDKSTPQTNLLARAKETLVVHLLSGTYRGFGFDRPRTLDTNPVRIPAECWKGVVSWSANELSYRSLKFREVRVRMMPEANDPVLKDLYKTAPVKAGRPSVGPDIEAAFHALNKAGEIDPKASQMSHYPKFRRWLELNRPNLPVPPARISNNTLQKFFSPLFNDLKKSHKL